ncbi:cytochrome P450 [Ascobolus immersus RN42]|uniref:Cytochrome P450 n=1 Tax=Ascobolus immersus RN42 TaxID=1160509 RepID=A0A3N4HZB6_ASCIM|nr:cytochrome P450 [Ascobolus immersus RN42]
MQVPFLSTHIYHAEAVRATMNNSTPEMLAALEDELILAFEDEVSELEKAADNDGWFRYPADAGLRIVSRSASRAMFGIGLCRNEAFNKLTIEFSLGFAKAGFAGMLLPNSVRNVLRPLLSRRPRESAKRITEIMRPELEKRMRRLESNLKAREEGRSGDIVPLPADTLSCLIEETHKHGPDHFTVENIAGCCRIYSFVAIHSTNLCIFHSLLNLASLTYQQDDGQRASYVPSLRDELSEIYASEVLPTATSEARHIDHQNAPKLHPFSKGWTGAALDGLRGLDSFVRENLRMKMQGPTSLHRTVAADGGITLKSGLHLPKGTFIAVPARSIQIHESNDPDAAEFNGWRTGRPGQADKGDAATTTSSTYFPFGTGKHACPGRFFAVKEIKLVLKHILLNYEIKEIEPRPKDPNLFVYQIPPTRGVSPILLRRRKVQ